MHLSFKKKNYDIFTISQLLLFFSPSFTGSLWFDLCIIHLNTGQQFYFCRDFHILFTSASPA